MISGDNSGKVPIYGLVLAGGKSVRMGEDKGRIKWHGIEQRYHMANMLSGFCNEVFISCRQEQVGVMDSSYKLLPDSVDGAGPICGILSAFKVYPDVAWLVIACDLPLLDEAILQYLIEKRVATTLASTFESPYDSLPEPLITIWEPLSYSLLLQFFNEGFNCPRKILIRNKERVNILQPPNPDALLNANTPADAKLVMSKIKVK